MSVLPQWMIMAGSRQDCARCESASCTPNNRHAMRTEYRGKLRRKHAARQLLFSSLLFFFYTIALYSIPSRADLRDHLRPQRPAKLVGPLSVLPMIITSDSSRRHRYQRQLTPIRKSSQIISLRIL